FQARGLLLVLARLRRLGSVAEGEDRPWLDPPPSSAPSSGGGGQAEDRRMEDVGDWARAIAGDDQQVELDELAALLLEDRAHAAARRQGLADAGAAQVADDAADVDPWAHLHILAQRLVGLVEEERGMHPPVAATVERQWIVDAREPLRRGGLVVGVHRRAEPVERQQVLARGLGARVRQ